MGGRGADERQKEQQIEGERERGGRVGREECRPRSNPSGMCSARQRVPEVTDKSRPHLCPMSDGPQRENEFYGGKKKRKNASRLFEIFNQSQGPNEKQGC